MALRYKNRALSECPTWQQQTCKVHEGNTSLSKRIEYDLYYIENWSLSLDIKILWMTLRHELAHVVIDAVSRNRAPRWLAEGLAIYLAGEGQSMSHYAPKTRLNSDELERRLERPTSQQDMRAPYAAAYRDVIGLIQRQSESGVWQQLAKY